MSNGKDPIKFKGSPVPHCGPASPFFIFFLLQDGPHSPGVDNRREIATFIQMCQISKRVFFFFHIFWSIIIVYITTTDMTFY